MSVIYDSDALYDTPGLYDFEEMPSVPLMIVELDLGDPLTTPTWAADITSYVRAWNSSRGTQRELQRVEAGQASITLDNLSGRFTPQNTLSVYYPNLLPMRRIRIRAAWNAVIYPIFQGFAEEWPASFPEVGDDQIVTVPLVDGFKVLSLAQVSGAFSQQLSGARVGAILDAISWPAGDRNLDTGLTTVPAVTLANTSALEHLQAVEHVEGGRLFMSRDGKVTFKQRSFGAAPDFNGRTWTDAGGAMSYRDIVLNFTDELIINDARLTRTGGVEQTASSSASQTKYGRRSFTESGLPMVNDNDVADFAAELVQIYGEPALRIDSLADNAMKHQRWEDLLARELRDRVLAQKTPAGSSLISQDSFFAGIQHSWVPDEWRTTLLLTPASNETRWILDDAVYSILNTSTILAR
ncbi:MAG: hypothetical protein ACREI2_11555 [Nitrospiraceae bacterium]